MSFSLRLLLPAMFGGIGFLIGGFSPIPYHVVEREYPVPHHVAQYPGNVSLRFAMVHDVIHERFPNHGRDYYVARNRAVERSVKKLDKSTSAKDRAEQFRLLDDLAVGLSKVGRHEEAVNLLRDKLKRQQALGQKGKELYSTYANLGTVLILWQLTEGVEDARRAKTRIQESIEWIKKAVEVYPESHFGREIWQLVLEQYLLAALDQPDLLLRYDMIGNRLEESFDPASRSFYGTFHLSSDKPLLIPRRARRPSERRMKIPHAGTSMRSHITRVGAEAGWSEAVKTSHTQSAPFDEPTLGIVGMWRMGAGANPFFALALGEIMLRVGQRHIAWTAYERAFRLKEHYWPERRIQAGFGEHCRTRQKSIEDSLPRENWPARRVQFDKDLAAGLSYQKAYQENETERLAAGTPVNDPQFYDAFDKQHGPIATPFGAEDKIILREKVIEVLPARLFVAGLLVFATVLAQARIRRRIQDRAAHVASLRAE